MCNTYTYLILNTISLLQLFNLENVTSLGNAYFKVKTSATIKKVIQM